MLIDCLGLQDPQMADYAFRYHTIIKLQRYKMYE